MLLEKRIAKLLTNQNKTVSIAESCTGGLLTHRLTNIPGSSHFLKLGVVTYSNQAKTTVLKVPETLLKRYGAVSEPVAMAMAKRVRKKLKTDLGVGITGIAGPSGGSKQKPVGLTYVAVDSPIEAVCLKCHFKGTRSSIKKQATSYALKLLLEFLI